MIADIVAEDANERDVLPVVVKGLPLREELISRILKEPKEACPSIRFGMYVDPEQILIAEYEPDREPKVVCRLNTVETLRHYDSEFGTRRIYQGYMVALVEAWLRDLAYRWKSDSSPPELERMSTIGLAQILEGGMTRREVAFGADALR
jgi:hypothetical protein